MTEFSNMVELECISPDDLQTYKHFLQLYIRQQEVVGQIQGYLSLKYKLKSLEQINIETGQITQL